MVLPSFFLFGASVTLVAGLLVPQWGLMMMALSVALSGAAFTFRAVEPDRPSGLRSSPGAAEPSPAPSGWDRMVDSDLPHFVLRLPWERLDSQAPDDSRAEEGDPLTDESAQGDRPYGEDVDVVDGSAGQPDSRSFSAGLVPVAWGSQVQRAGDELPDAHSSSSTVLARVAAEGERVRADVRDLHEQLRASLIAEVRKLAGDQERGRDRVAGAIDELHQICSALQQEVSGLSADYRQAREGLAGAVRQTATWLVKSRDEVQEKLDSLSRQIRNTASSQREDMQLMEAGLSQALADQRTEHDSLLANVSADWAPSEPLASRIQEQARLVAATLELQRQLHDKLEAISHQTENGRSLWREDMQELRDDLVQAVADQRTDDVSSLLEASARDRSGFDSLSSRVQDQVTLVAETLEQQRQLRAELASLRRKIVQATSAASRPAVVQDGQIAMLAGAVRDAVEEWSAAPGRTGPVDAQPPRDGARNRARESADKPASKRPTGKVATESGRAAAKSAVAPAAKAPVAKRAKAPAKTAAKAPVAKTGKAPAKTSAKAPVAKTEKASVAKARKAPAAKAAKAAVTKTAKAPAKTAKAPAKTAKAPAAKRRPTSTTN